MKLTETDIRLFYKLHSNLLQYALGKQAQTVFQQRDQEALIAARNSMFKNPRRITTFVKKNPFHFSPEELEILSSWKQARLGTFYIARKLKDYTEQEEPYWLYNTKVPRRGSTIPFDPQSPQWQSIKWAPAYDDDPDPAAEGELSGHK